VLDLSPIKIVIIIAVILIVLGPDKLPQAAHQLGSAWRALKEWQARIEQEVRDVVPDLPRTSDIARVVRSPVSLLNTLADRVTDSEKPPPDPAYVQSEASGSPPPTKGASPPPSPVASPTKERSNPFPAGDPSLN
jgi:TatA/E family protein of Tat protein translocase